MSDSPCICSICQERGHYTEKCPEIRPDFSSGFFKPAGGYSEGGDDDDEHISMFEYYFGMKLVWSKWI